MATKERWTHTPAAHDFEAAADYLSLLFDQAAVTGVVRRLRSAAITTRKAKDLLRASRLELLPVKDPEVVKDLAKVKKGQRLSPVLLVRGGLEADRPLTVADGYHRICASYHLDEDADIPCRLADLPSPRARSTSSTARKPSAGRR
ncbi:MAG: hypothetical protein NVS3B18_04890 [Candidatus Dormibacteria bacterium]